MNKTPLNEIHKELKAKMVNFFGWEMPVRYSSIQEEHNAVRNEAGLFDVSHMGLFFIKGDKAEDFLNYITVNDVSKLNQNQVQYSMILNEEGKILDDILVTKYKDGYYIIVNSANVNKIEKWLEEKKWDEVKIENSLGWKGIIALQGKKAAEILQKHVTTNVNHLIHFHVIDGQFDDKNVIISRSGYTGEDGFEIIFEREDAAMIWKSLIDDGVKPCGLGARDTLRLEAALPLYGMELSEEISPLETHVSWAVKMKKENFIGKEALVKEKNNGVKRTIIGLKMKEDVIARHEYKIKEGGTVTSGTLSPTLNIPIAMALVDKGVSKKKQVTVVVRDKEYKAEIIKLPFYKR